MTKSELNQQIAQTILDQLGGQRKLHAFVGARDYVAIDNGVMFTIKGSRQINKVEVKLNGKDLYDVRYIKVSRRYELGFKVVSESSDIYNDMLVADFEQTTGLYLHF